MRIAFFGYGLLGATVLRGLAPHHDIVLVVTHRPAFGGLGEPDVADAAAALGLPIEYAAIAGAPVCDRLRDVAPDVVVSTNWRTRVPADVLAVPVLGALNVHDALLPRRAGFGSVNWAIRDGDTEIGLTVHFMDDELDTGAIVHRTRVPIGPNDTAGEVLESLLAQYVPATLQALELVAAGHRGVPQDLRTATFGHRIGAADTRIDWSLGTTRLHNLVRGQSGPFVNAWTTFRDRRLVVLAAAQPLRAYPGTPGRLVRATEKGVAVACGRPGDTDGRGLILLSVCPDDGSPVPAADYFVRFDEYLI